MRRIFCCLRARSVSNWRCFIILINRWICSNSCVIDERVSFMIAFIQLWVIHVINRCLAQNISPVAQRCIHFCLFAFGQALLWLINSFIATASLLFIFRAYWDSRFFICLRLRVSTNRKTDSWAYNIWVIKLTEAFYVIYYFLWFFFNLRPIKIINSTFTWRCLWRRPKLRRLVSVHGCFCFYAISTGSVNDVFFRSKHGLNSSCN